MSESRPGNFQEFVLLAILSRDNAALGREIRETLETQLGKTIAIGALYTTLSALKDMNLVDWKTLPKTGERGGREKKIFWVTQPGQDALDNLERTRNALRALKDVRV